MDGLERKKVSLPGPSHQVAAYLSRPGDGEKHPGLVLIHEIWGLDSHIESVADRFANEGYAVIALDLMGSDPQLAPTFAPANVGAVRRFMGTLQAGRVERPGLPAGRAREAA